MPLRLEVFLSNKSPLKPNKSQMSGFNDLIDAPGGTFWVILNSNAPSLNPTIVRIETQSTTNRPPLI